MGGEEWSITGSSAAGWHCYVNTEGFSSRCIYIWVSSDLDTAENHGCVTSNGKTSSHSVVTCILHHMELKRLILVVIYSNYIGR